MLENFVLKKANVIIAINRIISTSSMNNNIANISTVIFDDEIENLHRISCDNKLKFYIDPLTGYKVMTKWCHLERGSCCGSKCRHCPYNYVNVKI